MIVKLMAGFVLGSLFAALVSPPSALAWGLIGALIMVLFT